MAGLVPKRRTRQEIDLANNLLLQRHSEYLQAWLKSYYGLGTLGAAANTRNPRTPAAADSNTRKPRQKVGA